MDAQSIFDTVAKALIAQGGPSLDPLLGCSYRAENGFKCAVGHLLLDSEYSPAFEGKSVDRIDLPERLKPFVTLLTELQQAHDLSLAAHGFAQWRQRMADLAILCDLSPAALIPSASESIGVPQSRSHFLPPSESFPL